MVTNARLRHQRKVLLEHMLETMQKDGTSEERILAVFSTRSQVSVAKAREYLKELKAARALEQEIPLA